MSTTGGIGTVGGVLVGVLVFDDAGGDVDDDLGAHGVHAGDLGGVLIAAATLGTQTIIYGICLVFTNAQPIGNFKDSYKNAVNGTWLKGIFTLNGESFPGIPYPRPPLSRPGRPREC